MPKKKSGWVNIAIPEDMLEKIRKIINNEYIKSTYAFRSPSDLIRRATSEYIRRLEQEISKASN